MGIDLSGIQHEYEMRGAHADAVGLASDESLRAANGLLKGDIYSVVRAFELENEVMDDDYLLISNFTRKALLAKVQNERLRDVDMLNDYYPLLFLMIDRYAPTRGMKMIDVIKAIADGVIDLERDVFPMVLNIFIPR